MGKSTLTCLACKATTTTSVNMRFGYCVGDVIDDTGWHPMPLEAGGLLWICPECGALAGRLARQLKELIAKEKDVYIRLDSLVEMDKDTDGSKKKG